jgi:hypothetical protein
MIHVTHHACERFIERVAGVTIEEARVAILSHTRAIEVAAAFGCQVVRLGSGQRLILNGSRVLTVYPRHDRPRQCRAPYRNGGLA